VSFLKRFAATRHLDDDVLAEIWSAAASEGCTATHPHLTSCAHCRSRYSALTEWLDALPVEARAEADEAFPPERLAAQQAAIFRRLEALEKPARVIAFPRSTRPATTSRHFTRRWIATAAAAGLVIGLAAGQILDLRHRLDVASPTRLAPVEISQRAPVARQFNVQTVNLSDEALFYGDYTADAESGPRSARYMPELDEITPRARDDFDRNR
jgi:hypothetical protein